RAPGTVSSEGSVALVDRGGRETGSVASSGSSSVFAGFRFSREVIAVAVRWYLRYGLSYRDVEELGRDLVAARCFFTRAMRAGVIPAGVTADRALPIRGSWMSWVPSALHTVERYASNPAGADHGRLNPVLADQC